MLTPLLVVMVWWFYINPHHRNTSDFEDEQDDEWLNKTYHNWMDYCHDYYSNCHLIYHRMRGKNDIR